MAVDPYSSCPCGSGKKFKWCCQPIYGGIEKAFSQHESGQHEAALVTMNQVVAANSSNPEAYGRQSMLLFNLGKAAEGEAALSKAFSISPNYPFGHYLKGQIRLAQGRIDEALQAFRKAADVYDPHAGQQLGAIWAKIAEVELRLNRPVAARAALQLAVRLDSTVPEYRQMIEQIFGEDSHFPQSAKREYTFKSQNSDATADEKSLWANALRQHSSGNLAAAKQAFEQITEADSNSAAAWFNLALARAWLGENQSALEALENCINFEQDDKQAADVWTLAEVLRCGQGVDVNETDYATHSKTYQIMDGQQVSNVLQSFDDENRLVGGQLNEEEQTFTAIFVEAPKVLVAGAAPAEAPRFAAHLIVMGNILRLWSIDKSKLTIISADLEQRTGESLGQPMEDVGFAHMAEALNESMVFPMVEDESQEEEAMQKVTDGMAEFYEETWIHRPRHSLSGVPPVDAAGHETLRKKLLGVIQFLEECAAAQKALYDFGRLRRKLGLEEPLLDESGKKDISAMSASELASLEADNLKFSELQQAIQAADRLDAKDISATFLQRLVAQPPPPESPDLFPWFGRLIQQSFAQSAFDDAMQQVDAGEKSDCEHNEGRRRNDYELWRGRVHARRGEVDAAQDVFDRLIARAPDELRYRTTATEAMISAKANDKALRFAQEGLAEARKQQNRDSEEHFMELAAAAEK